MDRRDFLKGASASGLGKGPAVSLPAAEAVLMS